MVVEDNMLQVYGIIIYHILKLYQSPRSWWHQSQAKTSKTLNRIFGDPIVADSSDVVERCLRTPRNGWVPCPELAALAYISHPSGAKTMGHHRSALHIEPGI